MIRQITDNVHWIYDCLPVDDKHLHISQYLISIDDSNILIDTGTDHLQDISVESLENILDGRELDVVIISHSTLPHIENIGEIEREWKEASIVASSPAPSIVGLGHARPKISNGTRILADQTLSFIEPLLTDLPASQWIYSHDTNILFTAEGFGHYHDSTECSCVSADMRGGIKVENIQKFYEDKLPYVKFFDPQKFETELYEFFRKLPVEYVAPMHGNVISQRDVTSYLDSNIQSIKRLSL